MGTNYYHVKDKCQTCGRSDGSVHIGKSSMGWPFSIHIIPEANICNWNDWMREFESGGKIVDEYGAEISAEDLNKIVVRKRQHKNETHVLDCYRDYPTFSKPDPETGDKLSTGEFF